MAKNDKILVTGAGGFVGGHMLGLLVNKGYENILATDIVEPRKLPENVKFKKSDLCNKKSLEKVTKNVTTIFHIADLFDFFAPFEKLYQVNVEGTINLCEAATKNRVRNMVKFSSSAIYKAGENINEEGEIKPIDKYALTKLLGELEAAKFNDRDIQIMFIRPAVIYGEGSKYGAAQAFLTQALGAKLMGSMILPGQGDKKGCFVHVEDIVNGTLHLYEGSYFTKSRHFSDMAYNISDDTGATPKEIAEMVFDNVKMNPLSKLLASKGAKLKLPRSVMDPLATACEAAVKFAHKKGFIKSKPSLMLEKGAVDYMFLGTDLTVSNERLKSTGYEFRHPSSLESMPEVIRWYEETGWEMFKR